MRENEFRRWMLGLGTMQLRPIGDAVSRCRRVIKALQVSLDAEYRKDGCASLLQKLEYTAEDERRGTSVDAGFDFSPGANLRNGMASLRAAVKKYVEFCKAERAKMSPGS